MDELDLLLEELALNAAAPGSVSDVTADGEVPGAGYVGLSKKEKGPVCSNVYSDLPAPVEASVEPDSPTKELDSILQDLMGLGEGDPVSSQTPPPLTPKQSLIRRTGGGQQEEEESRRSASSEAKDLTTSTKTNTIDDLLGGLSSDLEKIGVRTTAKGHCASCNKCVVGKMITALGEVWHPEHFVCVVCKTELSTTAFFEREGRPYCDRDYHQLFSPRCAYCKGPIVQNVLTALDQTWHPEHFFCMHCGGLFGPEGYRFPREGWKAILLQGLLPPLCSKVLRLWGVGEGELPDCSQWHLASRVLRLRRLSEAFQRRLFHGVGRSTPLLAALPFQAGNSVRRLR
ncbi:leupaxin isoform X3 [Scophthalmus maximus]|uniref:leupaxin isoform X3 n=1 Tax=Scophthalmus maximus TaxID=52904 RepID=UPI0015E0AB79|nr:leupaxin isoform X3 [Scophthalmus maximus]